MDEALEQLVSSLSEDEVLSIVELEDVDAMASANPQGIAVFCSAVESWPKDESEELWTSGLLSVERIRALLAGLGATVASGKGDERWTAAACYARLLEMDGAPVSLASPGLLRLLARVFEEGGGEAAPSRESRRRRTTSSSLEDDCSSEEEEEEDNGRARPKKRRKRATDKDQAFKLLAAAVASSNWARMQGELVRSEQTSVITRLASCFVKKRGGSDVDDALTSMLASDSGAAALEALLEPLAATSSSSKSVDKKHLVAIASACEDAEAVLGLRQRLCATASGLNASTRPRLVATIAALGKDDDESCQQFGEFLQRLLVCSCPSRRALAVDLLLETRGSEVAFDDVLKRAADRSPLVRGRALAALGQRAGDLRAEQKDRLGRLAAKTASLEDKANVRAKAIQVLEKLATAGDAHNLSTPPSAAAIEAASVGARDESPVVRMASVSALGSWLTDNPTSSVLQDAWTKHALAAALDSSPAVVSKVVDRVDQVFFDEGSLDSSTNGCASIVARSGHLRRCLRAALVASANKGNRNVFSNKTRAELVAKVLSTEKNKGLAEDASVLAPGLAVLEETLAAAASRISSQTSTRQQHEEGEHLPKSEEKSWAAAAAAIAERCGDDDDGTRASALRVTAALVHPTTMAETSSRQFSALESRLDRFRPLDLGPESIPALVRARQALPSHTFDKWAREQLDAATRALRAGRNELAALRLIAALASSSFARDDKDGAMAQAATEVVRLATPSERGEDLHTAHGGSDNFLLDYEALAHLCASSNGRLAKEYVPMLSREIHVSPLPTIRATCLVALSELCVEHASLVEARLGTVFRALTSDYDVGVRRHAIVLVTRLISRDYVKWRVEIAHRFFAATADDDEVNARLATAALVDALLPKHPTLIVNHFVAVLYVLNAARVAGSAPDDDPLRRAATNAIGVVDENTEHGHFSSAARRFERDLGERFAKHPAKRKKVYRILLDATPDEGKIQVAAKIASDVLATAADGGLGDLASNSSETAVPASNVLADALALYASDLKVTSAVRAFSGSSSTTTNNGHAAVADDDDDDELDDLVEEAAGGTSTPKRQVNRVLAAAKGRLLSKMSKRHLLEQILPILISLKTSLHKSPILSDLMACLRDILKTYPTEVDAVLSQDPHLRAELQYDLDRSNDQQQVAASS